MKRLTLGFENRHKNSQPITSTFLPIHLRRLMPVLTSKTKISKLKLKNHVKHQVNKDKESI